MAIKSLESLSSSETEDDCGPKLEDQNPKTIMPGVMVAHNAEAFSLVYNLIDTAATLEKNKATGAIALLVPSLIFRYSFSSPLIQLPPLATCLLL